MSLCLRRHRSEERREQQRRGHNSRNAAFRQNALSPESICSEATVSKLSVSAVFFDRDATVSSSHMPGMSREHGGAIRSMNDLHDDPGRVLP